jgi:selenocysteine-specific translation elongation factor
MKSVNFVQLGGGKDILIKSIQMHDEPVQESKRSARVGLVIKGVSYDEISRGDIICSPDYTIMRVAVSGNHISATL